MYLLVSLGLVLLLVLGCGLGWLSYAKRFGWRDDYSSLFAQSRSNLALLQAIMFFLYVLAHASWTLYLIYTIHPGLHADVLVGLSCALLVGALVLLAHRVNHARAWQLLALYRRLGSLGQVESEGRHSASR